MAAERTRYNVYIPFDIIFDILSRLPVKSLLRFKCVCKKWYSVIQSPYFIDKHRIQSSLKPKILLNSYFHPVNKYRVLNIDGAFDNPNEIDFNSTLAKFHFSVRYHFEIVGISNGLVCLHCDGFYRDGIFVFNPATQQFCYFPSLIKAWNNHLFRFLFIGKTSDSSHCFSLVKFKRSTDGNNLVTVSAQMYNINIGNWININLKIRDVTCLVLCHNYNHTEHHRAMPVILDGAFYWEACFDDKPHVSCLNIFNATYDEIRVPEADALVEYPKKYSRLVELKGELGLIFYGKPHELWLDLWVLNKSERNWTKKFVIKDSPILGDSARVMGCMGNGKFLVRDDEVCGLKLILYDLDTNETKTIYDPTGNTHYGYSCIYAETLIPVRKANGAKDMDTVFWQ